MVKVVQSMQCSEEKVRSCLGSTSKAKPSEGFKCESTGHYQP